MTFNNQDSHPRLCGHSAKRIKKLLDEEKSRLLSNISSEFVKDDPFQSTHKHDYIKVSQINSHMDRLSTQEYEVEKLKCKDLQKKQTLIDLTNGSGHPLDEEAAMTQCCVNQKHINSFFLNKKSPDFLTGRDVRRCFKAYSLAFKKLKNMSNYCFNSVKKYQIALLEENTDTKLKKDRPIDWMPLKMEERHFLMGHTVTYLLKN